VGVVTAAGGAGVVETQSAVLFFVGDRAYKMKKPVAERATARSRSSTRPAIRRTTDAVVLAEVLQAWTAQGHQGVAMIVAGASTLLTPMPSLRSVGMFADRRLNRGGV